MNRTLVLFTYYFPYTKGEAFIENEFPFLCKAFEKIIIITNELHATDKRPIPENVTIVRHPYHPSFRSKLSAIQAIFSKLFWEELKFIKAKLKLHLNKSILFTLLASITKGKETKDFILNEVAKKYELDIANTWFYSYWMDDTAISLAMLKKAHPEAKTFCRAHRGDLYLHTKEDNYLPLRPFLLNHLNKCYTISNDGKYYLENLLGKEATANVVVSKFGTFHFPPKLNIVRSNTFILVSCSTFTPPKRLHLIVDALSKLSGVQLRWLHFGEGRLREEIIEYTKSKLSQKEGIEFKFMDVFYNTALLKYYSENQIDLFINVSSSEGIPVSIMEAMSFGIPVIATDAGGTNEIVKDGYNGYLLPVNVEAEKIASAIKKFILLPDTQKSELSKNATNTWKEQYNAELNYNTFIESLLMS